MAPYAIDDRPPAPTPHTTIPVGATNKQIITSVAINSAPEENVLTFPLFGNEVLVSEQEVQYIGV